MKYEFKTGDGITHKSVPNVSQREEIYKLLKKHKYPLYREYSNNLGRGWYNPSNDFAKGLFVFTSVIVLLFYVFKFYNYKTQCSKAIPTGF